MELFDAKKLPWPCPREVCQVINEYTMDFRGLTLRQLEAVAFVHQAFPPPAGFHGAEFVDVNMSLGFMLSYKRGDAALTSESPWCPEPKTAVSGSRLAVRLSCPGNKRARPLDPFEYLQMIGWDRTMWRTDPLVGKMPSLDLRADLAGNALSAFAVGPLLSAAFAAMGYAWGLLESCEGSDNVAQEAGCPGDVLLAEPFADSDAASGG